MALLYKRTFFLSSFRLVIFLTIFLLCSVRINAQIYRVSEKKIEVNPIEKHKTEKEKNWKIHFSSAYDAGIIEDVQGNDISRAMESFRVGLFYIKDRFGVGVEGSKKEAADNKTPLLSYLKKQEIGGVLSFDITPDTQPKLYVLLLLGKEKTKPLFAMLPQV